jgi:uncharacterized protein (UPF0335 family)
MAKKETDRFFSSDSVKTFVERIERQEDEKAEIAASIRAIYAEAESKGFDPKALREVVRWRQADQEKLVAHRAMVEQYARELGMLVGTPLGDSALRSLKKAGLTIKPKVPPTGDEFPTDRSPVDEAPRAET